MQVSIVHDEFGRIVSVNRPSNHSKVVVLSDRQQSVLVTDVNEDQIASLLSGYQVDINNKALVNNIRPSSERSSR